MSKKQRAQEELKRMLANNPKPQPAPEEPSSVKHSLSIRYIDADGKEQRLELSESEINHFEFVKEHHLFLQLMRQPLDSEKLKTDLSYSLEMVWIPVDKILEMHGTRRIVFKSENQVDLFIKDNQ